MCCGVYSAAWLIDVLRVAQVLQQVVTGTALTVEELSWGWSWPIQ
jgi:hypothetical protein